MGVVTCYRTRRRLGAYLDGALSERDRASTAAHLAACPRCRSDAAILQRLRDRLRASLSVAAPADWTGFWAGIARGIEERQRPVAVPARIWPVWRPRLAFGGALAALLVGSLTLWQMWLPGGPSPAVAVSAAHTEIPDTGLMVYSPPEEDLAVVWIFEGD